MAVRFEIDPYNRLVSLPKFRRVVDGNFKTDANNNLSYLVKSPLSPDENVPNQLTLKGKWSLDDNHDLRLALDKQSRKTFGHQLTLKGELLDAAEDSLLFAVTTTRSDGKQATYILNLSGWWQADRNNRLTFHVRKENGKYDILTFNGAWEINGANQIVYEYEKARLISKKRETHTLTLKGYWDIKKKARLSYSLSGGTDSSFDFSAGAGVFGNDYIKYEVGIVFSGREKPVRRAVKLYGKWRLDKNLGLTFDVEYDNRGAQAISFGAELNLARRIFGNEGEAFIRAFASQKETAAYAGAGWRW